jgi:hemerythrin
MPLLKWKPEYSVNEAELDSHHIHMFDMFNMVYESLINNMDVNYIKQLVDVLSKLLTCHLAAEEKHMRDKGYSEIDAHIAEHVKFQNDIETLSINCHGNNLETAMEMIVLLGQWLLHHVLKEDKKYSYEMS